MAIGLACRHLQTHALFISGPSVWNIDRTRSLPRSATRQVSTRRSVFMMANSLQAARVEVMKILSRDLARQYTEPSKLDWSIFDDNVTFDDPTTKLSGKLLYKGMILTLGFFIVPVLFKKDAVFELKECELTEEGDKVRTVFATKGTTRWGNEVTISGVDFFWFGQRSTKITRHQSTWDQSADEVKKAFTGRS